MFQCSAVEIYNECVYFVVFFLLSLSVSMRQLSNVPDVRAIQMFKSNISIYVLRWRLYLEVGTSSETASSVVSVAGSIVVV